MCETSCPPQQQDIFKSRVPAAVPGLGTTDAKLHCCCWCCSPVLLFCCCGLGTRAHTRTVPLTSGWRVYISRRGTHQAGCAASRPRHLPSHSDRAQTLRSATSYVPLQRGFTATPARCWAALYGVGCLSVRAAKRSLYVSRARHLSACLFHVSASGAIIAAATANSRRLSQQNPYKTCVSLIELGRTSRHFIVHLKKIPTKSSSGMGVVPTG